MTENTNYLSAGNQSRSGKDFHNYRESTYDIVSIVAYLIGVPKKIFENENEPPLLSIYNRIKIDKNARIIRNLSMLRTAIERNFKNINDKMRNEFCSIASVPEYVPTECIDQLVSDGIDFIKKSNTQLNQHIIEINRILSDRINNCKRHFPDWLEWKYVKNIFLMPDGFTEKGTKAAADLYYQNKKDYPYQVYINWRPRNEGNILLNDKKFVTLLYEQNDDGFLDYKKVTDAGKETKGGIYEHIAKSRKSVILVDCENSDPYKLCSTLKCLDDEQMEKINKIILLDDVNTTSAWGVLEKYTSIEVEKVNVKRIKQDKSLVDMALTTRACKEHYQNNVDSFIIVSSDSDYWELIQSLDDADFLVMAEREKCGADLKRTLEENDYFYCYIDDFCSGNVEEIKQTVMIKEMNYYLGNVVKLNFYELLDRILLVSHIDMTADERQRFYDKYLKNAVLNVDNDGNVKIALKIK